jgi:DNA-binding NarL/FixJ family response regulator
VTAALLRVLLVDDHATVRHGLRLLIDSQPDMEVVGEAADGREAVEQTRAHHPDVVVMDIRMPGRDGVSVLRELGDPPPQVILMTAYANREQLRAAREANAFAVVYKPFRVPELLGLVATAAGVAA